MSNDLSGAIREVWVSGLQKLNRPDFKAMRICETKFSNWNWIGSIKFAKQAKITGWALNNYFDPITKTPITITNESFTPNIIRYTAIEISIEDDLQSYVNPKNQYLEDTKEYFMSEREKAIFNEAYARANTVFDDGDLDNPTNNGDGNPFYLNADNAYEVLVKLRTKMTKALIPQNNRWVIFGADEMGQILMSDRFAKSTVEAERRLKTWLIAVASGFEMIEATTLPEVAGVRHNLAWQGKPVSFGWVIAPKVYVSTVKENQDRFTSTIKSTEKFGVKVFDQGAQNLVDIQVAI